MGWLWASIAFASYLACGSLTARMILDDLVQPDGTFKSSDNAGIKALAGATFWPAVWALTILTGVVMFTIIPVAIPKPVRDRWKREADAEVDRKARAAITRKTEAQNALTRRIKQLADTNNLPYPITVEHTDPLGIGRVSPVDRLKTPCRHVNKVDTGRLNDTYIRQHCNDCGVELLSVRLGTAGWVTEFDKKITNPFRDGDTT
jgi:hypothetical protein